MDKGALGRSNPVSEKMDVVERMAVGDDQVEGAVVIIVGEFHAESAEEHRYLPQAESCGRIGEGSVPIVQEDRIGFEIDVRNNQVWYSVPVNVPEVATHSGLGPPAHPVSDLREKRVFGKRPVAIVYIQIISNGVVGYEYVNAPVVIEVRAHDAESLAVGGLQSSLPGYVGEGAVAVIVVQYVRNALKVVRVAIRPITGAAVSAKDVFRKVPIQITAHEQVEVTVVVIVEERGAGAPSARGYSRLCSSVGKRAVPVIDIENVLAEVSNVDIRIAVVVHIRHGDALTESAAGHSRLLRHI